MAWHDRFMEIGEPEAHYHARVAKMLLEAEQKIAAALALHHKHVNNEPCSQCGASCKYILGAPLCGHCEFVWPCPSVIALTRKE